MKKHSMRLNVDQDLRTWLKKEATRRHCSISQVFRDLIVAEIEKRNTVEKDEQKER